MTERELSELRQRALLRDLPVEPIHGHAYCWECEWRVSGYMLAIELDSLATGHADANGHITTMVCDPSGTNLLEWNGTKH